MLTEQEQAQVKRRLANSGKSVFVAYLLWFFVGLLGAHRFYNQKAKLGLLSILLSIAGLIAVFIPVHTQMPEYTQCVQNALKNTYADSDIICTPPIDQLSALSSSFMLLGAAILLALIIWWMIDGLTIPRAVRQNNEKLRLKFEEEIIKQRPSENT